MSNSINFLSPASPKSATRIVNMRITPEMDDIMTRLVEQRQFGYETRSDVVRDALNRHLIYLSSLDPSIKLPITIIQTAEDVGKCAERNLRFLKVIQDMSETVSNLISNGMSGEAARMIHGVKDNIEDLPESDWKTKYIREINHNFSKYLEALPDLTLFPEEMETSQPHQTPEIIKVIPGVEIPAISEADVPDIDEDLEPSTWFPEDDA